MSKNAWLVETPKTETEQEVDLALASISLAVDGASIQWQINCKKTLIKARKYINPNSKWDNLDEDMTLRLLRLSSDFTTEKMQEIVAKIIAGEYNQPWKFSLNTISIVRNLTKKDIELFQKFCWYVFNWKNFFVNWYNLNSKYLKILDNQWIWYDKFLYLQEIWLIWWRTFWQEFWEKWDNETEYQYQFSIQNLLVVLRKKWARTINWLWSLTKAWEELLSITWFQPNDTLKNIVIEQFNNLWFK